MGARATDWMEAFEDAIPLDRLRDAFTRALRVHESSFPVNAFDILKAYRQIEAEGVENRAELTSDEVLRPKKWDGEKIVEFDGTEDVIGINEGIGIMNKVFEKQGFDLRLKDTDSMDSVVEEMRPWFEGDNLYRRKKRRSNNT